MIRNGANGEGSCQWNDSWLDDEWMKETLTSLHTRISDACALSLEVEIRLFHMSSQLETDSLRSKIGQYSVTDWRRL